MGDKVKNFFSKYVVPWAMRTQIDPEGVLPYTGEIVDAKLAGNHEEAQELEKKQNKLQGNVGTLIGTVAAQATLFAPLVNTAWGIHGVHDIKKDIDEDGKISPLRVAADLMMVKGGFDSAKEAVVPIAKSAIAEYLLKKGISEASLPYATAKYYGPTMGKTTAAKTNKNLIDFDDISRGPLKDYAESVGMTKQQVMMSTEPKIVEGRTKVMEDVLAQAQNNPANAGKTIVISKSDLSSRFGSDAKIPSLKTFVERNARRGETDLQNSLDWYHSQLEKNPEITIDDRYISEIEADPHQIMLTSSESPKKVPSSTDYIMQSKPTSNIEVVKRQARSGPETVLYEDVDNPNIYIAKEEDLGRVWAQKLGKDDAGAGYVAWHADPAGEGSLTAAQRDNLIEALIENTEPGTIISASGKSPQGMLAYGAMAKKYPNKFQLVQFDGENLPYIESEIDFPWKYWTSDMTLEQKLNILNKKRAAFGMPEGTIQDGQMVFPWIGLKRLKKGGSVESGIHIKPENKGKFTALKKRTGKSSTWYKEHGTPAQKKMAVFALNAKKWKH